MTERTATDADRARQEVRPAEARGSAAPARGSATGPAAGVLALQRTAGNRAAARLLGADAPVSRPGDPSEVQAERMADRVLRTPGTSNVHRGPAPAAAGPSRAAPGALGGGQPLSDGERRFFEPRFGAGLGAVRVHTGPRAAALADAFSAQAFAWGPHVVFGAGRFAPQTAPGRRLLAHELAHTVQRDGDGARPTVQRQPSAAKEEAERIRKVEAEYKDELKKARAGGTWEQLALVLNVFNDADIFRKLDKLPIEEVRKIATAAGSPPQPWDVARVREPAVAMVKESDRVKQLKADYDAAVAAPNWESAARHLNAFKLEDMDLRLERLSVEQLRAMDAAAPKAMPGFSGRVHDRIVKALVALATASAATGVSVSTPSAGTSAVPDLSKMTDKESKKKWEAWLAGRDEQARAFGGADYEDYVRNVLVGGGSVFGRAIPADHPVHPLFLQRLEAASRAAQAVMGSTDFGIGTVSGQDNRPGNHAWGLAVDMDSNANPYIMNESGESEVDKLTAPVYERIAQTMLHRASVITPASGGAKPVASGLQGAGYLAVAEESDAMVAYFSVLPAPTLAAGKKALPAPRKLTSKTFAEEDIKKLDVAQVQADYDLLMGRKIVETVDGKSVSVDIDAAWRKRTRVGGSFPFSGGGSGHDRDPRRGFLTFRQEIVEAVRAQKMRWGATDFDRASGDVMHVDDGNRHGDYVAYGTAHPTEKRKKQDEEKAKEKAIEQEREKDGEKAKEQGAAPAAP
jgi:hypothetical protein